MTADIPGALLPLLTEPTYGFLGTVRPDGTPHVNPMWHQYDPGAGVIRFTHTTRRGKFKNLQQNPAMSYAVTDPANPFSYIEVRGALVEAIPDPTGAFYVVLQNRYGNPSDVPPPDSADRVILVMSIDKVLGR